MPRRFCCAWCHKTLQSGGAYRNPKTGTLVCGWCRINPVVNVTGKGCRGVHRTDAQHPAHSTVGNVVNPAPNTYSPNGEKETMKAEITIKLTDEQVAALAPLYEKVTKAFDDGTPGMLVAQCDSRRVLRVAFADAEKVEKLRDAIGATAHVFV